ncbi:hypothetical protein [Pandoraea communis]|uniref:hypothetical protein n=1 Tax=Pandoraea communis TaxID=2508297 RepID=UPI0025A4D0F0|nr:hypothetical protein [Pandoraea communis]MDM8354801.1 hypothetical protein [Pandoraea communis]
MKKGYSKVRTIVYVVMLFVICMTCGAVFMDFLIRPFLSEFALDSVQREWCGIMYRCANKSQMSFFEYAKTGAIWSKIDFDTEILRIKKMVFVSFMTGIGFVMLIIFYNRKR